MSPDIEIEKTLAQHPGTDQPNAIAFTFSDTIAGYVVSFNRNQKRFVIKTSDGRLFDAYLTSTASARITHNLEEGSHDCTARIAEMLSPGQLVYAYGVFYPEGETPRFEVNSLIFPGESPERYRHEEPEWWGHQVRALADSCLKRQFNHPNGTIDFRSYRTMRHSADTQKGDFRQETLALSQMVYGMSSAYLMTGEERFLEAAEKGTEYLRDHMRFQDVDEDTIYWYHGVKRSGDREQKLLASESGYDYDSIPLYEQIYALAGPTQTFRITGDPRVLSDIERTINLFERYYKDGKRGGYFSHIDPISFDPRSETLEKGNNRAKKNWNSVGDHAPAYLINLYLATGEQKYLDLLTYTADTIIEYFPDYEHSPFVQERFYEDWTHDLTWGWQQNRAVVGHNLKIAWNLMRIANACPKEGYIELAKRIAQILPNVGSDQQHGGWYDVVERELAQGERHHRFVWNDHKASWQQEQAILAYLILHGVQGEEFFLTQAREAASFYNTYFLDHDNGGAYVNTLASGMPYFRSSRSMGEPHSAELCYLSAVYTNLLITKRPMSLYFKPKARAFKGNILRVSPDLLPIGSVKLTHVWIDGEPFQDYDTYKLTVRLPEVDHDLGVKVTLTPMV